MPLSLDQLKALSMFAEGATNSEIAANLKVSQRSIQRWQKLPEFVDGLADIHAKATQSTVEATAANISNRIQKLLPKALDTIEYFIENPEVKSSDRLRACHIVGSWAGLNQIRPQPTQQIEAQETLKGYLNYLALNKNGITDQN